MRSKPGKVELYIVEPSKIISEGLASIIDSAPGDYTFEFAQTLNDFYRHPSFRSKDIVIINPSLIKNQEKHFLGIKEETNGVKWIGLVYSLFDTSLLSLFDETILIDDPVESILGKIRKLSANGAQTSKCVKETLSGREIELLKLLVSGNSNKEIANLLNISINTVITHRKNIAQKTGIKSVSGLAIYAVVNSIVDIESFS
jgi:DNA-binding CsgD family transcriptional regulator